MARDIFPASTKLMINEYGIISGGAKLTTYLGIINLLLERDLLDGIGIQGHYFSTTGSTANMVTSLDRLAETGLPIQVTEFDLSGLTDDAQLQSYQRVFPPIWEHPAVEGVTLWGWRLGSWRPEQMMHLVNSDGSERPALNHGYGNMCNPPFPWILWKNCRKRSVCTIIIPILSILLLK
jgi:endo-1,4-beta-xylanase